MISDDLHAKIIDRYIEKERYLLARIARLRAMIRELESDSAAEYGDAPADDHRLEKLYYPTIERGDMTEE